MSVPLKALRRSKVPPTALDRLKKSLGNRDAALLNEIPIDGIVMQEQHEENFDPFLGHKIDIGVIWMNTKCLTLWAYASRETRNGLPEISLYGCHPNDNSRHYLSIKAAIEQADLRIEFRQLPSTKQNMLSAIIKVCFMMKHGEFPDEIEFSEGFLDTVRRACRVYKTSAKSASAHSRDHEPTAGAVPPTISTRPKASMRKTEQRGPVQQQFGPLLLSRDDDIPRREDSVLSRSMSISPAPTPITPTSMGPSHVPTANMTPVAQPNISIKSPASKYMLDDGLVIQVLAEKSTTSDDNAADAKTSTPVPRHRSKPPHEASTYVDEYLELRKQQDIMNDELSALTEDIEKHDRVYEQRLADAKDYRDKQLPHLHRLRRQDLEAQQEVERNELLAIQKTKREDMVVEQTAEAQRLKKEYLDIKLEREESKQELLDQQRIKAEAKQALQEDIKLREDDMSKEQLLDFLYTQQSASKKRKREESENL